MAHYHGKRGLVYMSGVGAAAVSVAHLNAWTLDMASDLAEVTSFGDANKQYVAGIPDCKGTLAGTWDDTSDDMYDLSRSDDGVVMYLYPSSGVLTKYFYGNAWTDFSIDTSIADAVKIAGNFGAKDDWGQV